MIVPGVLPGSQGPLLYTSDEIGRNHMQWNGMPVTIGHPQDDNGRYVSARKPAVVDKYEIGRVYETNVAGNLISEAWIDVEVLNRSKNPKAKIIRNKLERGEPIELSTGLFTKNVPAPEGSNFFGRPYKFIATNFQPDHLAVLVDQQGACSMKDGCGLGVNAFCPTGPGGGQDNSCGRIDGGKGGSFNEASSTAKKATETVKKVEKELESKYDDPEKMPKSELRKMVDLHETAAKAHREAYMSHGDDDDVKDWTFHEKGMKRHETEASSFRTWLERSTTNNSNPLDDPDNDDDDDDPDGTDVYNYKAAFQNIIDTIARNAAESGCDWITIGGARVCLKDGNIDNKELAAKLGTRQAVVTSAKPASGKNSFKSAIDKANAQAKAEGYKHLADKMEKQNAPETKAKTMSTTSGRPQPKSIFAHIKDKLKAKFSRNAFCATGEGGGQDNSCGREGGGGGGTGGQGKPISAKAIRSQASKALHLSITADSAHGAELKPASKAAAKAHLKVRDTLNKAAAQAKDKEDKAEYNKLRQDVAYHTNEAHKYFAKAGMDTRKATDGFSLNKLYNPKSLNTGRYKKPGSGTGKGAQHQAAQDGYHGGPKMDCSCGGECEQCKKEVVKNFLRNTFCPTGPGGGQDNSCGKGEGGGGGSKSTLSDKAKALSKSAKTPQDHAKASKAHYKAAEHLRELAAQVPAGNFGERGFYQHSATQHYVEARIHESKAIVAKPNKGNSLKSLVERVHGKQEASKVFKR